MNKNMKQLIDRVTDNVSIPREITLERPKPKKGRFVLGTIVGAAAGAVAGLLLAPKNGKQHRQQLDRTTRGLRKQAADTATKVKSEVDKRVGQTEQFADTAATEVKRTARSAKRSTKRTAASAKRTAKTATRGAKRTAGTAKRATKRTTKSPRPRSANRSR